MNKPMYRPDIDGLRAIAVISVILFHLKSALLSGGFVGVDIFFVISGFLITSLIRKEISENRFTYRNFYTRRIRRIAPALLLMLVVTSLVAYIIFRPEEMYSYSKSLIGQVVSLQNIVFFSEGEYFLGSDLKPLLHTWSLAIEEQFYLFWPLLLVFIRKWKSGSVVIIFLVIILGSFVVNLLAAKISPKASFFLLPMRAWELASGGVLVVLTEKYDLDKLPKLVKSCIGWLGLAIIILSIFFINDTMTFPGCVAIFPIVGSMLLIITKPNSNSLLELILSNKYIVFIGLLSYSLYLWHWPILVFLRYLGLDLNSIWVLILVLLITTLLSCLSYLLFELPIRKKKLFSTSKQLFIVVFILFFALGLLSIHILNTKGAAYRYSKRSQPFLTASFDARSERCGFLWKLLNSHRNEVCELSVTKNPKHSILLWGNSHADMWSSMLIELAKENQSNLYLNAKNCRATVDHAFCNTARQKKIFTFIKNNNISDVILSSTWYGSYDVDDSIFEKSLMDVVKKLHQLKVKVWLVIDVPSSEQLNPVSSYALDENNPKYGYIYYQDYLKNKKNREVNFSNKIIRKFDLVKMIDPSSAYCDDSYCYSGSVDDLWYRDSNHVTNIGAFAAMGEFKVIFGGMSKH